MRLSSWRSGRFVLCNIIWPKAKPRFLAVYNATPERKPAIWAVQIVSASVRSVHLDRTAVHRCYLTVGNPARNCFCVQLIASGRALCPYVTNSLTQVYCCFVSTLAFQNDWYYFLDAFSKRNLKYHVDTTAGSFSLFDRFRGREGHADFINYNLFVKYVRFLTEFRRSHC